MVKGGPNGAEPTIAAFVAAPKSGAVLLAFAIVIGLTYMAALPPTAELLARSFGVERLSGLLGATMLVHQVGGFFGTWLGGVAVEHSGGYLPLWIADAALATIAATLQFLLMREPRSPRPAPSAAPPARWACAAARERPSDSSGPAGAPFHDRHYRAARRYR